MKKKNFLNFSILAGFLMIFSMMGCVSSNKLQSIIYFNQIKDTLLASQIQNADPTIEIGDRLSIVVTAQNSESVVPYNIGFSQNEGNMGYLVESDGTIQFPQLGKKKVIGLTRLKLVEILKNELIKYVNDPIVTIRFLNFKVTILGEVSSPGTKNILDDRLNVIDAISLAGDLTTFANRTKIMVIRQKDGKREFGEINILSRNVFNSPYFNLKQNDILYVEPTFKKIESENSFLKNLSITTSIISVVSTLIFLVINLTK